jgi:hypothetical protein
LRKAKNPKDIIFGIVDQHPVNRRDHLKSLPEKPTIRYLHCHPIESRGVCWARSVVFSLYQDEDYLLQIDSHMLFETDWDEQLVTQLEALRLRHPKPIVTNYPYGFEFINDLPVISIEDSGTTTLVLRPHEDTDLTPNNAILRFKSEHVFVREPILGGHIAAGFYFTLGRFIYEVPYDPYLYFHGEEQSLSIRAYTRGWDIFHIPHIPLYHLYKRPNTEHHSHHWHSCWEQQRDYQWTELQERAKQRLINLLYHQTLNESWGLGDIRSLNEFAELTGIDYEQRRLIERNYKTHYKRY